MKFSGLVTALLATAIACVSITDALSAGSIVEYPVPTANAQPAAIAAGPDGNLWATSMRSEKIGKITPARVITEFRALRPDSQSSAIAFGPDGNLWFTEDDGNRIGKITPTGQPIIGAWSTGDTTFDGSLVIVFFAGNGHYYQIENALGSDPTEFDGFEHGTYTWDPVTGAFSVRTIQDANGEAGLNSLAGATVTVSGNNPIVSVARAWDR